MNVGKKWKKLLAVGCSHGLYADPKAIAAVLKFREAYKPDACVHLGDFTDLSCFMASASLQAQAEAPQPDVDGGLDFLDKLKPTLVFCGNHEDRLWRLQHSPNAIIAHAAYDIVKQIASTCHKLRAELVPYDGVFQQRQIGNVTLTHGTIYNENSPRDMAEMYGNVIFAHTHKVGAMKGRRVDCPTGYCVGTLTKKGALEYAKTRRSTLAWSQGFVWGFYCEGKTGGQSVLWLHEQPANQAEWVLPL